MQCPWCCYEIKDDDGVISAINGLLYHDDCLDAFNDLNLAKQDGPGKHGPGEGIR